MFNYPRGYVQLPSGVCSTTLWSMFTHPGEYAQPPSGVCSTTLGSMFSYPREYVHEIRRAVWFCTQNTKSFINMCFNAGNEKALFYKNRHFQSQSEFKRAEFGTNFITRESICGHFRHSGLGWGAIWDQLFEKMFAFIRSEEQLVSGVRTQSPLYTILESLEMNKVFFMNSCLIYCKKQKSYLLTTSS